MPKVGAQEINLIIESANVYNRPPIMANTALKTISRLLEAIGIIKLFHT